MIMLMIIFVKIGISQIRALAHVSFFNIHLVTYHPIL